MTDKPDRVTESVFDAAKFKAASQETKRLQHDLDITNADHIALWIEANTVHDEPMSQYTSWLACRIVEAHEAALEALTARSQPGEDAVEAIGAMLLADPMCNGRVTLSTVRKIAALNAAALPVEQAGMRRVVHELRLSASVFRDYALQHTDKADEAVNPRERDNRLRKAKRNRERAEACEEALRAYCLTPSEDK